MACESPSELPIEEQILCDVQSQLQEERDAMDVINESIGYIGFEEWNFVLEFFAAEIVVFSVEHPQFSGSHLIVEYIKHLQGNLGFVGDDLDGVVGPGTLSRIYIQEYANNYESLGTLQKWRYQAYRQIGENYPDWQRYVSEQGRIINLRANEPNVFNRGYYLGNTEGEPFNGGFINTNLIGVVPGRENSQGVRGYLRRINGDFVLSVYVNGELVLASYASPGNVNRYGNDANTPQGNWSVQYLENRNVNTLTAEVNYISGGADSVRNTPNADGSFMSDPMPFAVRVNAGVFTHAGNTTGNSESHGCIRLPLHYAMGVYEIFRMHGEIHWDTNYS